MATVGQITARYENYLLPILGARPGVCEVCGTSVLGGWPRCYQCSQARSLLQLRADTVLPIALAVKGEQLAHELSSYKNSQSLRAREQMRVGLAAVLWRWLNLHENCVAAAVGVESFPLVTHVPSTSGRSEEPVRCILEEIVGLTRERYAPLLVANPDIPPTRAPDPDRFSAQRRLRGQPILLVDDTWTTGGHAQSAAYALKQAGSGPVGVVIIGRHFSARQTEPYREPAEAYLKESKRQGWNWNRCRLQ